MVRPLLALLAVLALAGCKPSQNQGGMGAPAEAPQPQASAGPSPADLPECRRRFRMVTDRPLSLDDFSNLAAASSVSTVRMGTDRLTLSYRAFDYEDHPDDGAWNGVGVVYARGDQAGAPVVGGVIWASDVEIGSSGGYALELRADELYLTLTPNDADPPARCRGSYVVKLDTDGVLYADGVKVGTLQ